ncbi:MAG: cobalamin-independent methionine synthase II family protein [Chloroflexi bacterium]|nr:MAG: cobalamin-independent methionine synthase II family protein [Chloroflexota bacterium]TMC29605.1 MAG: cobalamin-independent methionine synthase II family protein [Chloroflexota bacterium]TMC33622.1 MAG: cobalamin-independent methionine synthase II family protein [Chloroflexota bacterium]TMC57015.1 MAG: cobalamin-independent methionine synthase II family protein [Chloroflexota bacterium]TME38721.1 MAG: cobalamin-independent methionine synthase II family protein [Chloroflexota bacterium]
MRRSSERILTTHVGSLIRPPELLDAMRARDRDPARWNAAVSTAVRDVVQRQRDAGIDIVDDGEYSKTGFTAYVTDRLEGFEFRPPPPGQSAMLNRGRDRRAFADFYREYDATEGQTEGGMTAVCVGPIAYRGREVLERDFANLRAAMREAGADEAFIPAAAPGTIELQRTNAYYPSEETYLFAIADAMRTEYQAIVEAGFILQLDDPRVVVQWDLQDPAPTVAEYRAFAELRIAALNRAIAGLPEDRMRYHLCWGSWHGPHTTDIPLADIVDLVLRVGVGGYSIESANARHAHEWTVWERARLPAGKVLIPGVISHNTNAVEHPDLIAQRIVTFARLVGRENVIAGADCGFAQGAAYRRVHPSIMWAKLRALADGARLASARLWR